MVLLPKHTDTMYNMGMDAKKTKQKTTKHIRRIPIVLKDLEAVGGGVAEIDGDRGYDAVAGDLAQALARFSKRWAASFEQTR
jgi:hypothetical protein